MKALWLVPLVIALADGRCSIEWPKPNPTPSPTPTAEPAPSPTPTDVPTVPPPTPSPEPTQQTACPKQLAEGAWVKVNNSGYGLGHDATPYVCGDREFCESIHGTDAVIGKCCHLEGWPQRLACELELMGGCMIWEYTDDGGNTAHPCLQAPHPVASCDHWGSAAGKRDDPHTPEFEGEPAVCGKQRDANGDPMAGFWMYPNTGGPGHGVLVRACLPGYVGCGNWTEARH